jgi:hypothetical protein
MVAFFYGILINAQFPRLEIFLGPENRVQILGKEKY